MNEDFDLVSLRFVSRQPLRAWEDMRANFNLIGLHSRNLASMQFRRYRPVTLRWDAGWKTFGVVGIARPRRRAEICAIHFLDGTIPVVESPHYKFARAYLSGEPEGQSGYVEYQMAQHGMSKSAALNRAEGFRKLIDARPASVTYVSVAARVVEGKIVVVDGFHRASILLARGKTDALLTWLVGPVAR
ncbi:hypothetical protein N8716_00075 [Pontimonas sp.]|nr:hypothetical protein [Pontimonas sp.]